MSGTSHVAIVVTTVVTRPGGLPDMDAFRASLPDHLRPLVVGPIPAPFNGYVSYAFLPDGSKDGRATYFECADHRIRFADLFDQSFTDGDGVEDVVSVRYGPTPRGASNSPLSYYIELKKDA